MAEWQNGRMAEFVVPTICRGFWFTVAARTVAGMKSLGAARRRTIFWHSKMQRSSWCSQTIRSFWGTFRRWGLDCLLHNGSSVFWDDGHTRFCFTEGSKNRWHVAVPILCWPAWLAKGITLHEALVVFCHLLREASLAQMVVVKMYVLVADGLYRSSWSCKSHTAGCEGKTFNKDVVLLLAARVGSDWRASVLPQLQRGPDPQRDSLNATYPSNTRLR